MSYCTTSDISNEFKDITFDTDTSVTDTDVDSFIDQASSLINSFVSSKYEIPVTGSGALLFLKMICIWLVKARVISILSVKTPLDKTKQDPDSQKLYEQAISLLKQIKAGTLKLSDAVPASSDDGMTSFLMNEDVTYEFQLEMDKW